MLHNNLHAKLKGNSKGKEVKREGGENGNVYKTK
jgi:hypothetical protein